VLVQRIVTAAILGVAVVAAILYLPPLWLGVVFGIFWLVGAREWARFAQLGLFGTVAYVVVLAGCMAAAGWFTGLSSGVYAALAVAIAWWLVAAISVLRYPVRFSSAQTVAAGIVTLLPAWVLLVVLHASSADGRKLVLILLAIVWAADVGAYVVGRSMGRTKLAPNVSPGKTWEGVAGGLVLAAVVGAVASRFVGVTAVELALLAVATAAVSVLGDLTVSMFKRNAGLKDSGSFLPGHGGVLDRVDSLTAAVAIFVLGLNLAGIIT
jgi:phosphatidate cytidylyltransferase